MNIVVMDIPGISGESKLAGFEKKIDVLAFGHGIMIPLNNPREHERIADKTLHQEFVVTKNLDAASILLNLACCSGKDLGTIKIFVGQKQETGPIAISMIYELSHVIISTVSSSGSSETIMENVTLSYTKIRWTYTTGAAAPIIGGWNLVDNQAL